MRAMVPGAYGPPQTRNNRIAKIFTFGASLLRVRTTVMMIRVSASELSTALDLGMREADRLGLEASFEVVRRGSAAVTTCQLSQRGRHLMLGLGRGGGPFGRTSALFEALERLAVKRAGADGEHPVAVLAGQGVLPSADVVHRIAQSHPEAVLETWTYDGPRGHLHYPTLITNPFLATEEARRGNDFANKYLRYSSGLGTAAGTTFDQAVTHGLLELVEHDSLGLAFLSWFVGGRPPSVVRRDALPAEVATVVAALETTANRRIRLVDITTDLGIASYLAVMDAAPGDIPIQGSAARCDPIDAAIKAVGEVEQMWSLHGRAPEADRSLARWPVLERCRRLDLPFDSHADHVPDWESPTTSPLDSVTAALENAGLTAFTRVLSEPGSHVTAVSCLVPGLERFSMVRSGMPVVPTGRGRQIWESTQV